MSGKGSAALAAIGRAGFTFEAPGRIANDHVERLQAVIFDEMFGPCVCLLNGPGVANEERSADQGLERQAFRRLGIGVEFKGRQIEAESRDTDRSFANVDAVDLGI